MLLVGIVIGALASAVYSGIRSGEPDRLGSGLKQWLETPPKVVESAPAPAPAKQPARTTFDFFTVLPEIERVIPDDAMLEDTVPVATEPSTEAVVAPQRSSGRYMLQVASYSESAEADRMKLRLVKSGFAASIQHISIQGQGSFYRVRIGPFSNMTEMEAENHQLQTMGIQALRLKVSKP